MARVFISHASEDLSIAVEVCELLRSRQHQVFLDRDLHEGILLGEQWKRRLYHELRAADAVVCVVTAAYVSSEWCSAEIGISDAVGSRLLPLRGEPNISSKILDDLQYVDYHGDPSWRDQLVISLSRIDVLGGSGWVDKRSPFPGLRPFEVGMARVFYGRAEEVRRLTSQLRSSGEHGGGLLLVVGPSGCGKSSLVRAGVVPRIAGEPGWDVVQPFLPGPDPIGALARALVATANRAGLGWTIADTRRKLENDDDGLIALADELLFAGPRPPRDRLLLVIDQGEELLTRADSIGRDRFAILLRRSIIGPVQAVATLRSEFQDQLLVLPGLEETDVDTFPLRPLTRDRLRMVIEEPARVAGLSLDRELVDRLVGDTDDGEALPLLAFTLNRLADGLSRGERLLAARYEELGGVQGALARHADAALAAAVHGSGLDGKRVLASLAQLATVDEAGRRARRAVDLSRLPEPLRVAFDAFVDRRLLTTDSNGLGGRWVRVAHEALLTAWQPLDTAIGEQAIFLQAIHSVEQAAKAWDNADRPDDHLWERRRVTGAQSALDPSALSVQAVAFLDASRRRSDRLRIRTIALLSAALFLVTTGGITALVQWNAALSQREEARQQRRVALSRQLVAEASILRTSQPRISLALSIQAFDITPTLPETRSSLLSAQASYYGATLRPEKGAVHAVAFSADGFALATAQHDKSVCVWEMSRLGLVACPNTTAPVYGVVFSPDSSVLAAAGSDGNVTLWDARNLQKIAMLPGGPGPVGPVNGVAFSPDGKTLATATATGDANLTFWDLESRTRTVIPGYGGPLRAVAFSPAGNRVATGSDTGTVTIWDASSRAPIAAVTEHAEAVRAVAFSSDGRTLATGGDDVSVRLWDARTLSQLTPLTGPTRSVFGVAFNPNNRMLVSAGSDTVVGLWNVSGPPDDDLPEIRNGAVFGPSGILATAGRNHIPLLWETNHRGFAPMFRAELPGVRPPPGPAPGEAYGMAFSSDGSVLAAPATDDTAALWDVRTRRMSTVPGGRRSPVRAVAFSAEGRFLASVNENGDVGLWDVTDTPQAVGLFPAFHSGPINAVALNPTPVLPDVITAATGGDDGFVVLSDNRGGPTRVLQGDRAHVPITAIAFSGDGNVLASGNEDGTVKLWDTRTRNPLLTLSGHGRPVIAISFSGDGNMLASASTDGLIDLWEVLDGRLLATLTGRTGTTSVTFRPDGDQMLATADQVGTPVLWDIDAYRVREHICGGSRPILTRAEWMVHVPDEPYRQVCSDSPPDHS